MLPLSNLIPHSNALRAEFQKKGRKIELQKVLQLLLGIRQGYPHFNLPDQSQLSGFGGRCGCHAEVGVAVVQYAGGVVARTAFERLAPHHLGSQRWRGGLAPEASSDTSG